MTDGKLKVLVVGCGNMGTSHARAYHKLDAFEIVGLVSRTPTSRNRLAEELGGYPTFASLDEALHATTPEVVSINTYPETHADYARKSLEAGVFVEKPLMHSMSPIVDCGVHYVDVMPMN